MCYISKIKRSKQASNKQLTRKTINAWLVTEVEPRRFPTHTHTHTHRPS